MAQTDTMGRPPLQRVPPHDPQLEAHLLGAALVRPAAAQVLAAALDPFDFYVPHHQVIADVVVDLVQNGSPTDSGTVAAELRRRGTLESARGANYLNDLVAEVPSTTSAAAWVDRIKHAARQRRILNRASDVIEGVYKGLDVGGLIADMGVTAGEQAEARGSSWEQVNLAAALAGDGEDVRPTLLQRDDGNYLLYRGKVHAFNAEPEAAKTWLALLCAKQVIDDGGHVLYIDFEGGVNDIVARLLELGLEPGAILEFFHYVRPDDPLDAGARLRVAQLLEAYTITYAVIDGVAEALAMNGWKENDAADVTAFFVSLPRPLAAAGAAVVVIDHLVKDKDNQGRYARGSTAKLAGVDGATFKLEVVKPFGRGKAGLARLIVTKDRHGWVRQLASGTKVAEFSLASAGDGRSVTAELRSPDAPDAAEAWVPTECMSAVEDFLISVKGEEVSRRTLPRRIRVLRHGFRDATVYEAVERLVADPASPVIERGGTRGARLYSVPASWSPPPVEPDDEDEPF